MAIRVAHVGTGNVGRLALTELVTNPQFELTGLCVSTPEKVGKDAGALAGVDVATGIAAVNDLDAVIATRPECVVYCAMGDTRLPDAMKDVMRILAAGINVVGSSPGMLQYPWGVMPDKYIDRVEDAARQGNSSIFINGVDPGFINDLIPFALASTCQRIEQVRCMEIADYATYDGAEVMHYMGFGRPLDDVPMLLLPGVLSIAWGGAIRQLAAGLGIELDEITESYEREPAPEFPGISLAARRNINLAIISFAELLCENVDAYGLAARAKEAVARRVHEMNFGTRPDCEAYMLRVQKAQTAVSNQKQITVALKAKLERLRATCEYRNNADTVPTADSLAPPLPELDPAKNEKPPGAAAWNVLAEDYWDLYTLLLR